MSTKTPKQLKPKFDSYYQPLWGERWSALKQALLKSNRYVARLNAFADADSLNEHFPLKSHLSGFSIPVIPLEAKKDMEYDQNGLSLFYAMDLASIFPVLALQVQKTDSVLDFCAAPGGKALMLLEQVRDLTQVTLNEYSSARRQRLKQVLQEYLPKELISKISILAQDGRRLGIKLQEQEKYFDKILLDVPCSGERHLLHHAKELKKWTSARTKQLSQRQYALLCSAWLALRPGGRLVYSTCSISSLENDQVIERFLKKKSGVKIVKMRCPWGEATEYGWQVLPDQAEGWGPIYFTILEKK